jgi:hypothetical protein
MLEDIRPGAVVSPREFATICNIGEGHVRQLLGAGKLDSVKVGQRRWIPISVIIQRYAEQLVTDSTRAGVLNQLQRNAAFARVDIGTDEDLVQNARLYLGAANLAPSDESVIEHEPTWSKAREFAASGD